MVLQKQSLSFPFVASQDEKTSDIHVQPPGVLKCQNVYNDKLGEVAKTKGYTRFVNDEINTKTFTATAERKLINGNTLIGRGDETLQIATAIGTDLESSDYDMGDELASYDETLSKWRQINTLPQVTYELKRGYTALQEAVIWDYCKCNDYHAYIITYEASPGASNLKIFVTDSEDNVVMEAEYTNTALIGQGAFKLVPFPDQDKILVFRGTSGTITYNTIDLTDYSMVYAAANTDITDNAGNWKIMHIESSGVHYALHAYTLASGQIKVVLMAHDATTVRSYESISTTNAVPLGLGLWESHPTHGPRVAVFLRSSGNNNINCYTISISDFVRRTSRQLITEAKLDDNTVVTGSEEFYGSADADNRYRVWYQIYDSSTKTYHVRTLQTGLTGATLATGGMLLSNACIHSMACSHGPYDVDTDHYARYSHIVVGIPNLSGSDVEVKTNQPTAYLIKVANENAKDITTTEVWNTQVVAKILTGTSGITRGATNWAYISHMYLDGNSMHTGILEEDRVISSSSAIGSTYKSRVLHQLKIDFFEKLNWVDFDGRIIIGGGQVMQYDGVLFPLGFHQYPEDLTTAETTSTSKNLVTGNTYGSRVVYEYVDTYGDLHRSAPSAAASQAITAANNAITVTFPTYQWANSHHIYRCIGRVYRTVAGVIGLYYSTGVSLDPASAYTGYVKLGYIPNDISDALSDYLFSVLIGKFTDSQLQSQMALYTESGYVENMAPPASNILCKWQNRLCLVPYDNTKSIWYSKSKTNGVGLEFNSIQVINVSDSNDIVGIAELDQKLIIFTDKSIKYTFGEGPNSLGQGYFPVPQALSNSVGAESHQAIVNTPVGLMFKSDSDFYMLSRDLQLNSIGEGVDDSIDNTVISAALYEDKEQVRFLMSDNVILIYNYRYNQWFEQTGFAAGADMAVIDDKPCLLDTDAYVYQGDDTYQIHETDMTQTVKTPWYQFAQHQGLQRIYWVNLLAEYKAACTLTIKVYIDYDDSTVIETITKAYASDPNPPQIRFKPKQSKCQAMRLDIEVSGATEGLVLQGLRFDVGVKKGSGRLGSSKTL